MRSFLHVARVEASGDGAGDFPQVDGAIPVASVAAPRSVP